MRARYRRGKEWDDVDKAEKKRIELKKKEDGEFWCVADDPVMETFQIKIQILEWKKKSVKMCHPPS